MEYQKLLDIGIKKRNKEIKDSWNSLAKDTPFKTGELFRMWVKNQLRRQKPVTPTEQHNFKETLDINADGSQSSNRLVKMSFEESKDPAYLLKAHGYSVEAWELISARSNIWNAYSDQNGIMQLYSSKITVKPKKQSFTYDKLIEIVNDVEPVTIEIKPIIVAEGGLLEVALVDPHFGISTYEDYKLTQDRIAIKIMSAKWKEILYLIGQDMLHNDNFRGQTANGTQIETVDTAKAWSDAVRFYSPLIELSLKQSKRVKVMYSKGNHDESLSWAFVQMLKAMYPQATFDDAMEERKCHTFGANFIGITHGDKARKNLHNIFPIEFPMEWSRAKNRELHIGHLHVEDAKDVYGMMIRTLATRNKTDKWHRDSGFVGAHKRFMLFEYSLEELESIHYV